MVDGGIIGRDTDAGVTVEKKAQVGLERIGSERRVPDGNEMRGSGDCCCR